MSNFHPAYLRQRVLQRAIRRLEHCVGSEDMSKAVELERQRQTLLKQANNLAEEAANIVCASISRNTRL